MGILFVGGRDQPHLEAFKQGMREHGYTEGKNVIFEYRYAEGKQERLGELAAELVREKSMLSSPRRRSALKLPVK